MRNPRGLIQRFNQEGRQVTKFHDNLSLANQ